MTDYRAVAMAWVAEPGHRPMVEAAARHLHANESLHLHDNVEGKEPCSYCWLRAAKAVQAIERNGQHIVKALAPEQFAEIEAADLHSLQADAQHNPDVWTLNEWRKQLLAEVQRQQQRAENAESGVMKHAKQVDALTASHEQMKTRVREAEANAKDLNEARTADGARMVQADNRVRELEQENAQLREDAAKLNALETAGVDNWDGYSYAMEILNEGEGR